MAPALYVNNINKTYLDYFANHFFEYVSIIVNMTSQEQHILFLMHSQCYNYALALFYYHIKLAEVCTLSVLPCFGYLENSPLHDCLLLILKKLLIVVSLAPSHLVLRYMYIKI